MKKHASYLLVSILAVSFMSFTGSKDEKNMNSQKKTKKFTVSRVMPFSAAKVWAVVGEDYGKVADSHPKIIKSEYLNGTLKGEEGAERICYFNEKGSQYLKEKIKDFSPDNMSFTNIVYQAGKFPVDPEVTRAIYKVEKIDDDHSKLVFDMQFRTKPAFMGSMMKGQFKGLIEDYLLSVEHHLKTGEKVNRDNFKKIKKQY